MPAYKKIAAMAKSIHTRFSFGVLVRSISRIFKSAFFGALKEAVRDPKIFSAHLLGVAALSILAFKESVWLDEGLQWDFAQWSFSDILDLALHRDAHPPLYGWLLHAWSYFFGTSVFAFRTVSILCAIAFVFILSNLIRKTFPKITLGFLSVILLYTSPFVVFYGMELRSYMLVVLLGFVQWLAFDLVLEKKASFAPYIVLSVLGLYVSYTFVFFIAGQAIFALFFCRKDFLRFVVPGVTILFLFVPWILFGIMGRAGGTPEHFLPIPWYQVPAIVFVGFATGRVGVTDMRHLHWLWPTFIGSISYACLFAILFVPSFFRRLPKQTQRAVGVLLSALFVTTLFSLVKFSLFDPRYHAPSFGLFLFVSASILCTFFAEKMRFRYGALFLLVASHAVLFFLVAGNPWFMRESWKSAVPALESELHTGDAVLFVGKFQPPPTYRIYQTKDADIVGTYPDTLSDISDMAASRAHIESELSDNSRVWFSQFLVWQKDPNHVYADMLSSLGYRYVKTIGFFKVTFDLYER